MTENLLDHILTLTVANAYDNIGIYSHEYHTDDPSQVSPGIHITEPRLQGIWFHVAKKQPRTW